MRVVLEGEKDGQRLRYTYDLLDVYDRETGTTSLARTTGYTATIAARQVARGRFTQTGILPPEFMGRTPGLFEAFMDEYAKRNIALKETVTSL